MTRQPILCRTCAHRGPVLDGRTTCRSTDRVGWPDRMAWLERVGLCETGDPGERDTVPAGMPDCHGWAEVAQR